MQQDLKWTNWAPRESRLLLTSLHILMYHDGWDVHFHDQVGIDMFAGTNPTKTCKYSWMFLILDSTFNIYNMKVSNNQPFQMFLEVPKQICKRDSHIFPNSSCMRCMDLGSHRQTDQCPEQPGNGALVARHRFCHSSGSLGDERSDVFLSLALHLNRFQIESSFEIHKYQFIYVLEHVQKKKKYDPVIQRVSMSSSQKNKKLFALRRLCYRTFRQQRHRMGKKTLAAASNTMSYYMKPWNTSGRKNRLWMISLDMFLIVYYGPFGIITWFSFQLLWRWT